METAVDRLAERHPLATFFALAYGISWLIWSPLWLPALGFTGFPVLPLHHALGALGPITAALIVTGRTNGASGVRDLLRRMIAWRDRVGWLVVALGAPVALLGMALVVASSMGETVPPLSDAMRSREHPTWSVLLVVGYHLFSFGYGEEVGWRGFALPRLQARHGALSATGLLTLAWSAWHIPLFLYRPGYVEMGLAGVLGWMVSLFTGAVLLTWLYNESRGSLLVVALFHASIDLAFTGDVTSGTVTNLVGAAVTVWGIVVLVSCGPRWLARGGKMTLSPTGDGGTVFVPRQP